MHGVERGVQGNGYAIEARGLRKTYPGDVQALDGLSVTVASGTVFALLGPNGAGKSTTVKILTTLSRPDEGEAQVAGIDVLREPGRVRRAIGVVGQPTAPGSRNGGAVSRNRLRLCSRSHAASSCRYHISPRGTPSRNRHMW